MRNFDTKSDNTAPAASGRLPAAQFNAIAEELENAVTTAGITLDPSGGPDNNTAMLAEAQARYASGGKWVQDTGSANAYVLDGESTFVVPGTLFKHQWVDWLPANTNTGASTANVEVAGSKPILTHAWTPLAGGEIVEDRPCQMYYEPTVGAAGSWILPPWANALMFVSSPASTFAAASGEGIYVDGSNQVNLNFNGLESGTPENDDLFAFCKNGELDHENITLDGLRTLLGVSASGIVGVQNITTLGPSTYTKTSGTTKALVFATAGGGGGAGGVGDGGYFAHAGGGGGGTAVAFVDLSSTSTVACAVGAGGAGGSIASSGHGASGGSTSFGAHAVATGGAGAQAASYHGLSGLGGGASAGLMRLAGQGGGNSQSIAGGHGGGSFFGAGGAGGNNSAGRPNGAAGGNYGGGGGGGDGHVADGYPIVFTGGSGGSGCILVIEFG